MKKHTPFFTLTLLCAMAFAAESKIITLEGKVRSFDQKSIRITTTKGVVEVPREFVAKGVQLKTDETIVIPLTEQQLAKIK